MDRAFLRPAALIVASVAISLTACNPRLVKPDAPPPITLARMVAEVQDAIDPFWCPSDANACQSDLPPLEQVKLTLQTVRDTKVAAEVDYLVLAVQGSRDYSDTQEIALTLTPHQEAVETDAAHADVPDDLASIRKALIDAIRRAQRSINKTYGDGDYQLDTDEISVQMSFTVTWAGKAGGAKVPVLNLLASPSWEGSIKTTNTITVTFARPHKKGFPA